MKYDISICLAGIRPYNWLKLYKSIEDSCNKHSWELVIVSPFDLPNELKYYNNIKYLRDYGCPTRSSQLTVLVSSGRLMTFSIDDGFYLPDALNKSVDLLNQKNHKDAVVMRYKEGAGFINNPNAPSFPDEYWNACFHLDPNHTKFKPDWKIAPQPMLRLDYFYELGGINCLRYSAMSFGTWSLCGRLQDDGGIFYLSPEVCMLADNYGATGHDHKPIFDVHSGDHHQFLTERQINPQIKINFDNWKDSPEVWNKRFGKKKYLTHEEMMRDMG